MSEFVDGFLTAVQLMAFVGGFTLAVGLTFLAVGILGEAFRRTLIP